MRDDFAKLLVERPRHGHGRSYGEHRHDKSHKDTELYFGGRESMKKRYDSYGDRKQFNENLNPLKGWLRSVIGKQWDKSYSELREKFDARSTINQHILEHLWHYVETHAFIVDGKVMCHVRFMYRSEDRIVPIKQGQKGYYVCPKDGTLKASNRVPRKAQKRAHEIAQAEAKAKVFRALNAHQHLRFENGVWFVFEVKDVPLATMEFRKPAHYGTEPQLFRRGYSPTGKMVDWDSLTWLDRERYGTMKIIGTVTDILSGAKIYRTANRNQTTISEAGHGKYYFSKFTASHKILKEAGLDGTAAANDDQKLSHREASKYKKVV